MKIADNLSKIKSNIEIAKQKSIYKNDITIVGVTKFIDIEDMKKAFELGVKNFGENRPQEIKRKFDIMGDIVSWHQIGTLQKNKVKYIIDKIELIHSLDSISLAQEIDKYANKLDKIQNCLLQIKVSKEETKKGIDELEIKNIFYDISQNFHNIRMCGIMGMAPYVEDEEKARDYFKRIKDIFEEIRAVNDNKDFKILSMGMSNDYRVAIQEGSNMIRVGRELFN